MAALQHNRLRWYGHVLKKLTVGALRNILILWLKVLVQDVGKREHGWKEDVKSLKINEEDALVHSKW